jgi:hypothetical protein
VSLGVTFPPGRAGFFDRDRWASSYHEAGHCVVAMLLGWRVEGAWILGGEGLQAVTRYKSGNWKRPAEWADLVVSLAGPIAESTQGGEDLLTVLEHGIEHERSDLHRARREAERLARFGLFTTPDHALLAAEQTARALLARHWDHVVRTAETLYRDGRIE